MYSDGVGFTENDVNPSFWFGLKVGYRFGKAIEELNNGEKMIKKNIVSFHLSNGGVYLGMFYERMLKPFLSIEAGLGFLGFLPERKFIFLQ